MYYCLIVKDQKIQKLITSNEDESFYFKDKVVNYFNDVGLDGEYIFRSIEFNHGYLFQICGYDIAFAFQSTN